MSTIAETVQGWLQSFDPEATVVAVFHRRPDGRGHHLQGMGGQAMTNRVDPVKLRRIGKRAHWVARQDDEGPLVLAAADAVDRLQRIEKLVQERSAGGHEVIRIADLIWALDGGGTPVDPKLTAADVDMAWLSYRKDAEDPRKEAEAWNRYMDVLKKWRAQQ